MWCLWNWDVIFIIVTGICEGYPEQAKRLHWDQMVNINNNTETNTVVIENLTYL